MAPFQTIASGILSLGGKIASGLTSMMGVALKAIMPAAMVGVVLAGLGLIYQQFGTEIDQMLAMAQQQGPQIISNLANGISSALPGLISSGAQLVTGLLNTITANLPALIGGGHPDYREPCQWRSSSGAVPDFLSGDHDRAVCGQRCIGNPAADHHGYAAPAGIGPGSCCQSADLDLFGHAGSHVVYQWHWSEPAADFNDSSADHRYAGGRPHCGNPAVDFCNSNGYHISDRYNHEYGLDFSRYSDCQGHW